MESVRPLDLLIVALLARILALIEAARAAPAGGRAPPIQVGAAAALRSPVPQAAFADPIVQLAALDPIAALAALSPTAALSALSPALRAFNPALNPRAALLAFNPAAAPALAVLPPPSAMFPIPCSIPPPPLWSAGPFPG